MKEKLLFGCLITLMVFLSGAPMVVRADDTPLPKWETEEEKALRELGLWPVPDRSVDSPPAYSPVSMAEFDPMEGMLIRYSGTEYESTYRGMIDAAQEEGLVWIWVNNSSTQTTVTNKINSWGVPMTNIRFLVSSSNSIWLRDYGPSWIFNASGDREIIDFSYDRPRPQDDAFPTWLGGQWSMPVYQTDLLYEGGNFIADGCGTCFASNRIYDQNASQYTPAQVDQIMEDYFGCDRLIVLTHMIGDGTGHIDMFCKLLDIDTILLAQVDPGHQDYTILENNATLLEGLLASNGNPYEIVRIPMGSDYRCFTNSLILNNKVIMPTYYGGSGLDVQATGIYEAAMPGYEIVGVDCHDIIDAGGAIHCITMGVPRGPEYNAGITSVLIDDAFGDDDGMMDPGEMAYLQITLRNSGIEPLNNLSGILTSDLPGSVTILDDEALWPNLAFGASGLSLSPHFQIQVDDSVAEGTQVELSLDLVADDYSAMKTFTLTVTRLGLAFEWNLDTNPGWTTEDQWAWGQPQGNSGDPNSGYTGSNVYGYNLAGKYANNLPERSLTSSAIDCSNLENVEVHFMRWLGVESALYDHASFRVSSNGTTWTTIWNHTGGTLTDTSWQTMEYDISAVADGQSTVYLRWVMGTSDSSLAYCGWNIDDIEVWGASTIIEPTPTPPPSPTATPSSECVNHGDVNFSGDLTAGDAQMAFQVALGTITPTFEEECAADCNGDESVTAGDAQAIFLTVLGQASCADPI